MDKTFKLEIVTPVKVIFTGAVLHVKAPGIKGYFGILHNHAPFLTALKIGVIEVRSGQGMKLFATSGGFAEVVENVMKILVETCEAAAEIDIERAERARDRAMQRLEHRSADVDAVRAQAALARAMNRLQAVQMKE
jgi:F-type H+-transporting ATPase subunit epsilon